LSDLHLGRVTPSALQQRAVDDLNAAEPDLVALTGDFISRGRAFIPRITDLVRSIHAPKVAVLGNHDHWSDADRVRGALEDAGVIVLSNSWITVGGAVDLVIVGIDDWSTGHSDAEAATRGLPDLPAVGLAHNPESAPLLWEKGVGLVLSGHTHGGQLEFGGLMRRFHENVLGKRFVDGWYEDSGCHVYVNPGVGSSLFPWRTGTAMRAVALIDLNGEVVED
jgi:uncharacterized protein